MTYRPTVRGRRLARELRRLRENLGLTLQDVADRLDWSRATVSRVETGQTRPKVADVARMLELYGVPSPDRDALITLARDAGQRGWWTAYADVFAGSYVALEDEASAIRTWDPQLVHGLLQTEDYARAVITAGRMLPGRTEIERRIAARKVRQKLLDRENAPLLHVVLDEAVLHRPLGGASVMNAQLRKLSVMTERPNVTVQVLPYTFTSKAQRKQAYTGVASIASSRRRCPPRIPRTSSSRQQGAACEQPATRTRPRPLAHVLIQRQRRPVRRSGRTTGRPVCGPRLQGPLRSGADPVGEGLAGPARHRTHRIVRPARPPARPARARRRAAVRGRGRRSRPRPLPAAAFRAK